MPTLKEFADVGGAAVLAAVAFYVVRQFATFTASTLRQYQQAQEKFIQHLQEQRSQFTEREAEQRMQFTQVVNNHLDHVTESLAGNSEVIRQNSSIIDRCCQVLERLGAPVKPPE